MHYCCLVITKEFPTDEVLEKVMAPYNEEDYYKAQDQGEGPERPIILWDWWQVGGRYGGQFKLAMRDNDPEYKWEFYDKEPKEGRLYRSNAFIKIYELLNGRTYGWPTYHEEDFYQYMGCRDGYLLVDGGRIRDLINFESVGCYCFIDADGQAFARERWVGEEWQDIDDFDELLKNTIEASREYYACIVDIHD